MAARMPGYRNDAQRLVEQAQCRAVFQLAIQARDVFCGWAPDLAVGGRLDGRQPARMIAVVVGDQHMGQIVFRVPAQPSDHGHGIARVNHGGAVALGIQDQPDVIVLKGR